MFLFIFLLCMFLIWSACELADIAGEMRIIDGRIDKNNAAIDDLMNRIQCEMDESSNS